MQNYIDDKKYYIPSIDEFHVGFEFEYLEYLEDDDREWFSNIYCDTLSKSKCYIKKSFLWDYMELNKAINSGDIRVKYLDKDDIESLGFIYTDENYTNYGDGYKGYIKNVTKIANRESNYGLKCMIHYNDKTNFTIIEAGMFNSFGGNWKFKGTIKNKSELKKLMEQLEIKCN